MKQHEKLCYLPTRRLCSLNEALDDGHFPEARENVFRQETTTYEYIDEGVKITRFVRNYSGSTHWDSTSSEIIKHRENWNGPTHS